MVDDRATPVRNLRNLGTVEGIKDSMIGTPGLQNWLVILDGKAGWL